MTKKRSAIWKISKEELQNIVDSSESYKEVLAYFNRSNHSRGSYTTLKRRIKEDKIDTAKLKERRAKAQNLFITGLNKEKGIPLELILVENSTYNHRHNLKLRLLKEGYLKEECYKCGMGPYWQGEKLSLQLDHINGFYNDNRLENLRLLCPNCHSQTSTFSGKHFHANNTEIKLCINCHKKISKTTKTSYCLKCYGQVVDKSTPQRKVERPEKDELLQLIVTKPFTQIGEKYGVSDNAIRKWCKYYELPFRKKDIKMYLKEKEREIVVK